MEKTVLVEVLAEIRLVEQKIDEQQVKLITLKDSLKEYCQDKAIPLDERYELFMNYELGHESIFIWEPESLKHSSYLGEWFHRGNEYTTDIYIECIEDEIEYGDNDEEWDENFVSLVKEEILQSWVYSFIFDW